MLRTAFLVDGFNLYHSLRKAHRDLTGESTKWLDIRSLCTDHLYLIDRTAICSSIFYYSALAKHIDARKPGLTARHQFYIDCLADSGITIELARFKKKQLRCDSCGSYIERYEEKETDVAIAIKLFELFHNGACEAAVLLTGDTDIAPAVRAVFTAFPKARLHFAFPYARKNKELAQLCPSFAFSKETYLKHQFPDPYDLADGRKIVKPPDW